MKSMSFEAIAYQGRYNPLVALVVERFTRSIELYKNERFSDHKNTLDEICAYVKDYTGFKTSITLIDPTTVSKMLFSPYRASVSIPSTASFNPLNPKAMKAYSNGDIRSFKPETLLDGTMDFKQGKVTGFYSAINYDIEYTTMMFDGRLSGEELAAVYFHELGHVWSISVMLGQSLITSALCAGVTDFFNRHEDVAKRMTFGRMVLSSVDPKADADPTVESLTKVIVTSVEQRFQNTTGLKFKANELNERLADQFAVKWGLGLSMALVIKKLQTNNSFAGKVGLASKWTGVVGASVTLIQIPWKSLMSPAMLVGSTKLKVITGGVWTVTTIVSMTIIAMMVEGIGVLINPNGRHPSSKERIKALKREHIALLQQKISAKERAAILADIDAIDDAYEEVLEWDDLFEDVFSQLGGYITGKQRDINAKDSIADRTHNQLDELTARLEALK